MKKITYIEIRKLINSGNIIRAMYFLEKYIKNNPDDEYAKGTYVSLLLSNNRIEEAEFYLNNIFNSKYDKSYHLYRIAFLKGEYDKAYKLLPKAKNAFYNLTHIKSTFQLEKIFLEKRLGLLKKVKNFDKIGYLRQQIVSYDDQRAIEHIEIHKDKDKLEESQEVFEEELDITTLFNLVKKSLISDKLNICQMDKISNAYYFEYPDVSEVVLRRDCKYKYLKVIAFRDTKEIITMYPISTDEIIENINYLKQEKVKIKRFSQIDKFNKRYGRDN